MGFEIREDMDADYSPQYVKLARILRAKIESGRYRQGDNLPSADLAREYGVPRGWCVAWTRSLALQSKLLYS